MRVSSVSATHSLPTIRVSYVGTSHSLPTIKVSSVRSIQQPAHCQSIFC
jgi:hypothetical protein